MAAANNPCGLMGMAVDWSSARLACGSWMCWRCRRRKSVAMWQVKVEVVVEPLALGREPLGYSYDLTSAWNALERLQLVGLVVAVAAPAGLMTIEVVSDVLVECVLLHKTPHY